MERNCNMTKELFANALIKYFAGVLLVGALVFVPAGTLDYFGGWLFMAILFVPMFFAGLVMMAKSPKLLEKRLDAKEKLEDQGMVVKLSGLMFIAGFVVAGLCYRWQILMVPKVVSIGFAVVFLLSYVIYAEVMRENAYLSRTIEVQENQKVIDTGLYGLVRHPMYAATIWLFLAIPVVLGSWWSLLCFLPYVVVIVIRIINEEDVLSRELPGYGEYRKKVKYRLFPFVW
jgi:protein-S-isoprenylcysteine O-methyltransferase Ste14